MPLTSHPEFWKKLRTPMMMAFYLVVLALCVTGFALGMTSIARSLLK
jgi:hypothetical protein